MKKFFAAWLPVMLLILVSCGGELPQGGETDPPEGLTLGTVSLELSAPEGSGSEFLPAARAFSEALQLALEAQGITAERMELSFSRADSATAQALSEGGVSLGVLQPLAALRQEGVRPVSFAVRSADGPSCGVIAAADSAYGAQLAKRAEGESPISWKEWSRAVFGAVESDGMLYAAADFAFTEATDHGLGQLGGFRSFATEEALLAAMAAGEVDAALLRKDRAEGYPLLLETGTLYEAVFAVSEADETFSGEWVTAALQSALAAAAETDAGMRFLAQYGGSAWVAAEKEETEALERLAKWEDIR